MQTVIIPGRGSKPGDMELQALRDAADLEAQENWHKPEFQAKYLNDLAYLVWEGFQYNNVLDQWADVEYAGEFERITIEEVRGLQVYWTSDGGYIQESHMTDRVWELPRDECGFHVVEKLRKIRSGFSKWFDRMVSLAPSQLQGEFNSRLLRTIQASIGPSSPYYTSTSGISLSTIDTLLTEVGDTITDDEGYAIVGRKTVTDQLLNELQSSNLFAPATQDEMLRTGRLGVYKGAPIIELRNFRDQYDRPTIPAGMLIIAAKSATKVGIWGGLMAQTWDEMGGGTDTYHHEYGSMEAGFAVARPDHIRVYMDTSL